MKKTVTIAIIICLTYLHLSSLKFIPGTFGDEALIGVQAYQIVHGDWSGFVNPFYNRHFEYVIGALPVYTTAPFVALFGLNDFTIRIAPAAFGLLSLILLYGVMGKLKLGWFPKIYAVLLYSSSPIFFHVSHTNFGHTFSLFFILSGYYFFLGKKFVLSGILFGLSIYGYLGYSIAIFILLSGLIISEIWKNQLEIKKYFGIAVLLISFIAASTPQIYMILTNPDFTKRLIQKNVNNGQFLTRQKLINMAKLYPGYFSKEVLFEKAEVELPGGFVSRHSIKGHGLFLPVSLALILLAVTAPFLPGQNKYKYLPFYWLFLLFPLPDLITASPNNPPYPFSLYTTSYFLPFISAFSLDRWRQRISTDKKGIIKITLALILTLITLSQFWSFWTDYSTYRLYAADYWGWQYGPSEIIKYFTDHQNEYDELILHSAFNGPEALIPFYDPEKKCPKCELGGILKYSADKKQLFAFRVGEEIKSLEAYPKLKLVFHPQVYIYLSNGQPEYKIGVFKAQKP